MQGNYHPSGRTTGMLRRTPDFQTGMSMLAIVSCSQVFFGCGQAQEQAQKGTTRISPCELFTGEQKRLEPHLALAGSGCVKVDYNGPELPIKVELELWHNGTSKSGGGPSTSITQPSEVSISVKEVSDAKEKSKYQVITVVSTKSGTISTTQLVDVPELNRGLTSPKRLGNTIEIKDTKPVAVWALVTDKGSVGGGRDDETFEAAAKRAKSALVLKFSKGKT